MLTQNSERTTKFYFGLSLAITSCFFIGSSLVIKKFVHKRLSSRHGETRAATGGYGYLTDWIWWTGLLLMILGEAANFAAYALVPASLVTPLGALSVLVSTLMASIFLKERLNLLTKIGCSLCIFGSTIIVIHSPKKEEVEHFIALQEKILSTGILIYIAFIVLSWISVAVFVAPKYGHTNCLVYLYLCSGIGSLSVLCCKALGLAIRDTISGRANEFRKWMPWFLIIVTVIFIIIQINYLNKALDIFNTGIVSPVYYVMFTTLVVIASAILFKEFQHMTLENVLGDLCGFLIVIVAVFMLNAFKDVDVPITSTREFDNEVIVLGNQGDFSIESELREEYI